MYIFNINRYYFLSRTAVYEKPWQYSQVYKIL